MSINFIRELFYSRYLRPYGSRKEKEWINRVAAQRWLFYAVQRWRFFKGEPNDPCRKLRRPRGILILLSQAYIDLLKFRAHNTKATHKDVVIESWKIAALCLKHF